MTTPAELLSGLEGEVQKLVDDLEVEVGKEFARKSSADASAIAKELMAHGWTGPGASSAPQPTPAPSQPQPKKLGGDQPYVNYLNRPSMRNRKSNWRGLKGLWKYIMDGDATTPKAPAKVRNPLYSKDKDSWLYDGDKYAYNAEEQPWMFESILARRPTVKQYMEYRQSVFNFADEIIEELAGTDATVANPELSPIFARFRTELLKVLNAYQSRAAVPSQPEPEPEEGPTSPDDFVKPGDLSSVEDDPRNALHPPDASPIDNTSGSDIAQAHADDLAQKAAVGAEDNVKVKPDTNKSAFEDARKAVAAGKIEAPNQTWFTPAGRIVAHKLPHIVAWLVSQGKVKNAADGIDRAVNILDSDDVRQALASYGYKGRGQILDQIRSRNADIIDDEGFKKAILEPLGWTGGFGNKPKKVGVAPVQKEKKPEPPEQPVEEPVVSEPVKAKEPDKAPDEPSQPVADKEPEKPAFAPSQPKIIRKPVEEPRKPESIDEMLPKLDDRMKVILDKETNDDVRAEKRADWEKKRERILSGEMKASDVMDYLDRLDARSKSKYGGVLLKKNHNVNLDHFELGNEKVLRLIEASKLEGPQLKDYYLSLLKKST